MNIFQFWSLNLIAASSFTFSGRGSTSFSHNKAFNKALAKNIGAKQTDNNCRMHYTVATTYEFCWWENAVYWEILKNGKEELKKEEQLPVLKNTAFYLLSPSPLD